MKTLFTLPLFLGLASCAAPKAIVIEVAPVKPVKKAVADAPKPSVPGDPNDGLRLPDMLALPSDDQLRRSTAPSGDGAAPVIARPPKE